MLIIYTGLGKGKTSASIGAIIRSIGWGKKVALVQFIKEESWASGEREVLKKLGVDVFVMGKSWVGIMGDKKELEVHIKAARKGISKLSKLLMTKKYDLVVADEILGALYGKLLLRKEVEKVLDILSNYPNTDLIMTGRNAPKWLLDNSDLVTEMKKIKHPYDKGILAKKGIDY